MKELYKKLKGEKTNLTIYWSGGIVSYLNMPIKARSICEGTWLSFISFFFPLASTQYLIIIEFSVFLIPVFETPSLFVFCVFFYPLFCYFISSTSYSCVIFLFLCLCSLLRCCPCLTTACLLHHR